MTRKLWLGMLVTVLAFGLAFMGCEDQDEEAPEGYAAYVEVADADPTPDVGEVAEAVPDYEVAEVAPAAPVNGVSVLPGAWIHADGRVFNFDATGFSVLVGGVPFVSGTYTSAGGVVTLTVPGMDAISGTYSVEGATLSLDAAFPGFENLTLTRAY